MVSAEVARWLRRQRLRREARSLVRHLAVAARRAHAAGEMQGWSRMVALQAKALARLHRRQARAEQRR